MRLSLTVVDPIGGASADVMLDADPESSVGDIARELARQVGLGDGAQIIPIGGQRSPGGAPQAYVDGYALDPSATVVGSPLREEPSSACTIRRAASPGSRPVSWSSGWSAVPRPVPCTGSVWGGTT